MKKIICFGEVLIDFLRTGSENSDGLQINHFNQYPGGAPANVAVAIAKLGAQTAIVGQVGQDMFGEFLINSLNRYGVDTQYLFQHPVASTTLAFVSLDAQGERTFSFYRDNTADVIFSPGQIDEQMFNSAGILHFCSNTLTTIGIAKTTEAMIQQAVQHNLLVSFDVNLRHNLWERGAADKQTVQTFVEMANVLKFSREEICYLTDDINDYVNHLLANNAQLVVITNDGDDIEYFTRSHRGTVQIPNVEVKDTTAGGDAFTGGLLYALNNNESFLNGQCDPDQIRSAIEFASKCGAFAVTKPGAFPSLPVLDDLKNTFG